MRFREHRGGLVESMETLFEFATREELEAHLKALPAEPPFHLTQLAPTPDYRIGWNETWILTDKHGVVGFTDGPVPDLPLRSFSPPASSTGA